MPIMPCQLIAEHSGKLYECSEVGEYMRIRTPYVYPDGDVIELYLKEDGNGKLTISDLGETLRWLDGQTISPQRSKRQLRLIEDVCHTHSIEFKRGSLCVQLPEASAMASAISRLTEAAIRVADLWFTFRPRSVASFTDDVEDFLVEHSFSFERGKELIGRSGEKWTINFAIPRPTKSALIYTLSTGSRGAARKLAEHVVAACFDLRDQRLNGLVPARFVSLFDDSIDVWTDEEFKLVEEVADVALWSQQDELTQTLAAA